MWVRGQYKIFTLTVLLPPTLLPKNASDDTRSEARKRMHNRPEMPNLLVVIVIEKLRNSSDWVLLSTWRAVNEWFANLLFVFIYLRVTKHRRSRFDLTRGFSAPWGLRWAYVRSLHDRLTRWNGKQQRRTIPIYFVWVWPQGNSTLFWPRTASKLFFKRKLTLTLCNCHLQYQKAVHNLCGSLCSF